MTLFKELIQLFSQKKSCDEAEEQRCYYTLRLLRERGAAGLNCKDPALGKGYRLSARISDLRKRGYIIETERIRYCSNKGRPVRYGNYVLIEEPARI